MTLHFSISLDQCGYSFESAALPWAEMGYPIIPIVEKRRARRGLVPSTSPDQIRAWAHAYPQANAGVVLNELPVVVFDVDGEPGEHALAALLESAGCSLPLTYEETTGRDGGRHIFMRLPAGSGLDSNQYGGTRGRPAGLDVLVNGHVVVAGARHKSGRFYTSLYPMRPPEELAEIPGELCRRLAARVGRRELRVVEVSASPSTQGLMAVTPPPNVAALLKDTSDGRDSRAFVAVSRLSELGWTEEDIVRVVMDSPLGAKARMTSQGVV